VRWIALVRPWRRQNQAISTVDRNDVENCANTGRRVRRQGSALRYASLATAAHELIAFCSSPRETVLRQAAGGVPSHCMNARVNAFAPENPSIVAIAEMLFPVSCNN